MPDTIICIILFTFNKYNKKIEENNIYINHNKNILPISKILNLNDNKRHNKLKITLKIIILTNLSKHQRYTK